MFIDWKVQYTKHVNSSQDYIVLMHFLSKSGKILKWYTEAFSKVHVATKIARIVKRILEKKKWEKKVCLISRLTV